MDPSPGLHNLSCKVNPFPFLTYFPDSILQALYAPAVSLYLRNPFHTFLVLVGKVNGLRGKCSLRFSLTKAFDLKGSISFSCLLKLSFKFETTG